MITVDRADFLAWSDGILLAFRNGVGICPNEAACERAEAALKRGERIALTVDGSIVSTMHDDGEAYAEEKWNG